MIIWLDAYLSPGIAWWLSKNYKVKAFALRDLKLREADDEDIFQAAKQSADIVITKDEDFVSLLNRHGSQPKIIWLTCGNTSDFALREILAKRFEEALRLFEVGNDLVEIGSF